MPKFYEKYIQLHSTYFTKSFSGKSLICKERAIKSAEKEEDAVNMGLKQTASPVFFIFLPTKVIFHKPHLLTYFWYDPIFAKNVQQLCSNEICRD